MGPLVSFQLKMSTCFFPVSCSFFFIFYASLSLTLLLLVFFSPYHTRYFYIKLFVRDAMRKKLVERREIFVTKRGRISNWKKPRAFIAISTILFQFSIYSDFFHYIFFPHHLRPLFTRATLFSCTCIYNLFFFLLFLFFIISILIFCISNNSSRFQCCVSLNFSVTTENARFFVMSRTRWEIRVSGYYIVTTTWVEYSV